MRGVVACFIRLENESFAGDAFMRRPIFSAYPYIPPFRKIKKFSNLRNEIC
ncbi:hypothetical protein HMPREF1584_00734 [Gardnerella vaginalis JCP8481A]|uniref:Uncharacterized protein n=1 Tax=Gardnerella vaginalis TaxID=2702 RepID=A0A133NUT0_GARVA|nr:hypothetical protein HMPREF1585_00977 [Gardnerella vaginalis JCP8481B]EPI42958.1 hypothetical protein HMPREF1584_00734 [Gardnerella vaginalis JCP8481A]KXA20044.1 hypothetical protein HMPREF3208_00883 [Gardnerella vaginalis]